MPKEPLISPLLYMQRLRDKLLNDVRAGLITLDNANAILSTNANTLEQLIRRNDWGGYDPTSLDYWSKIDKPAGEWQTYITDYANKAQQSFQKKESIKSQYFPLASAYYDKLIQQGKMTQAQKEATIAHEEGLIDSGVSLTNLPNYPSVQVSTKMREGVISSEQRHEFEVRQAEALNNVQRFYQARQQQRLNQFIDIQNQKAVQQERFRQALINRPETLSPPKNWIEKWQREHIIPTQPIETDIEFTQQQLAQQERSLTQFRPELREQFPDIQQPTALTRIPELQTELGELSTRLEQAEAGLGLPPTPDWLARLVPGLTVGQPIRRDVQLPTPSAQQWRRLAPSKQRKYVEFASFAGQEPEDIFARAQQMLPRQPSLGRRFAPVRQR